MAVTNGYTTLDKIKQLMLPESRTDVLDDSVIEDMITQSSRLIDGITRRTFYARSETRYYDVPSGRTLYLWDDDLLTVTSLKNGDGTTIAAAEYQQLPLNGTPKWALRLKQSSTVSWTGDSSGNSEGVIPVAGMWGYSATAPADIEQLCQRFTVAAYHHRMGENTTGVATITAAGVVITPQDMSGLDQQILRNYTRVVLHGA